VTFSPTTDPIEPPRKKNSIAPMMTGIPPIVPEPITMASDLSDRVVLLRRGKALAAGAPAEILSPDLLRRAFGVESRIEIGPDGKRRIVPYAPTRL
jgi:iron complex transport system ATP-binding protein